MTHSDLFTSSLNPPFAERSVTLRQTWRVGALCLAIADSLQARFNPVTVHGELTGFSRAPSGHCYFTLKDADGQLRAAMFKRAATSLTFAPADGQQVEVTGRLGVYEQRGELQLVVDSMSRLGQGVLLEAFMRLKTKLQDAGLFSSDRKRQLIAYPQGIGVVTSPNAAAWHDVVTALKRRVPHVPVALSPALVQGASAPQELIAALHRLYALIDEGKLRLDVILLVRGGGSLEDLWAFNDEQLAYTIAQSPVPVICGVGHETDFSIADFVADVRAPTPTAAAELCAEPLHQTQAALELKGTQLRKAAESWLDKQMQSLDHQASRLLKPSDQIVRQQQRLEHVSQRLHQYCQSKIQNQKYQLDQHQTRLELLHPQKVLDRGFAWVSDESGQVVVDAAKLSVHQRLIVHLAKGATQVRVD